MDKRLLIAQPVAAELEAFNTYYRESVSSENHRIQKIIDYIMQSDGKKIRPNLLLLAAKACGSISDATYGAAVTIELLHTASLVHDDVVDEADMRRGRASVNAIYDNKMAVLTGDFFLSTALIKAVMTGNIDIITTISNLGRILAEGELNQLSLVKEFIISEKEYFAVISKKTASLLSGCMKIGAMSVNASDDQIKMFATLGEYLGICFQLRDDIFDYFNNDVGKPTGNDIREGKVTLPLLYAIENADTETRNRIVSLITSRDFSEENVQILSSFAKDNGGIEYAYAKIEEQREKAAKIIDTIEHQEVKAALQAALEYIVERIY